MVRYSRTRKKPAFGRQSQTFILDTYGPGEIKRLKESQEALARVHWQWYSELAGQRAKVIDELKAALAAAAVGPYHFESFQRAVKYRWSLNPLSPKGSLKDPGGRFNIGEIDLTRYPASPALYVAKDKSTAIQELFNVESSGRRGLNPQDLALTSDDSVSIVAVKGSLESVIDLNQPGRLKPFVQIIGKFQTSAGLIRAAKAFESILNMATIQTVQMLVMTLLQPNWRNFPMHVDVPASTQIFGNLVEQAGIEGILYPSKYTKKECLAIFTRNFVGGESYVELTGNLPEGVDIKRLDSSNCKDF